MRSMIADGVDILLATIIWKSNDITISSHIGIAAAQGKKWGIVCSKLLNMFQTNHCENAMRNDLNDAQSVITQLTPYAK
jgi:hypothetical protein